MDHRFRCFSGSCDTDMVNLSGKARTVFYAIYGGNFFHTFRRLNAIHWQTYCFHLQYVVYNVRILLNSLKGSPVGLKLNVELNNFFLNCFAYHVDLWATFLGNCDANLIFELSSNILIYHTVLVSPAVQYLFIPLAIIGCLGLSFQLALLSDLLVLISVHAHCFYIYAAV